jgi:hypothetical protein
MRAILAFLAVVSIHIAGSYCPGADAPAFEGKYFRGRGDVEYLKLLDIARRMLDPDPEYQNLPMLYMPSWNGLVEGPTWDAWWIQNSYGTTYCAIPFWEEPYRTFIANSHDLWFDQMGDGKRKGAHDWVAPDGCLCDAARPGWIYYRQGDGRVDIHDWGMEFTAAGVLLQAELLLATRDPRAIEKSLPRLERSADFIESRRDPEKNLFLAGPAGNLLAPSFAGWKRPDGTYGKAYLAGLSITTIAALDRLIELEKLAGRADRAALYAGRRDLARKGLPLVMQPEGYFIMSLDPDGTRHGVFGAPRHGYFEAPPNHDAICFRVVDDAQAERIFSFLASIPGLRPFDFVIPNFPSYDDMYEKPAGLWGFGTWVNGGHWSTCEARMVMAYSRLGKHEDARRSMERLLGFARRFRMDNPLVRFGSDVYQPGEPINLCYDSFGPAAALLRGLFEYLYSADGLTLVPHVPPGIVALEQRFPIRLGEKRLRISTRGTGPVTAVLVNGEPWPRFDARSISFPHASTPADALVRIALGGAKLDGEPAAPPAVVRTAPPPEVEESFWTSPWVVREAPPSNLPLRIGADSLGGSRFLGEIARARVFLRALAPAEIEGLARGEGPAADPSLVGDWKLGDLRDGGVAGAPGGGLRAALKGEGAPIETPRGKAVRLDGKGFLEVADDPRLDLGDAYTLEALISPRAHPDGGGRIIDKSTVGTSDNFLLDTHPRNSLRLITRRGTLGFDAKLPPGEWAHVAATFDAKGELRLYLNGKLAASAPAGAPPGAEPAAGLPASLARIRRFLGKLEASGLGGSYEAAHARLVLAAAAAARERRDLAERGKLPPLPPASARAADRSYVVTASRLSAGLEKVLAAYGASEDAGKKKIGEIWEAAGR